MQSVLRYIWQRLGFPLMVTLAFVPVPMMAFAYFAPALLPVVWVWPTAYLLMDVASTVIPGKWRIAYGVGELSVMGAMAAWMFVRTGHIQVFVVLAMYAVLTIVGLALSAEDRLGQNVLIGYLVAGVVIHFITQLLLRNANVAQNPVLELLGIWLLTSFFLFVGLGLVMLNYANLLAISRGRLRASQAMQRKNTLVTLALMGIALGVSLIPAVLAAISKLFQWIFALIRWLFNLWGRMEPVPLEPGESSEQNSFGTGKTETALSWIEMLIKILVLLLIAAALVTLLYLLTKKIISFLRILRKKMQQYLYAASQDYVDEITDTRKDDNHIESRQRKKKISAMELRKLPPDQRIRHRYRQLMQKHPQWAAGSTARENLNDTAASIYERVRYSEYSADEEIARCFAEETKKV